jgi:hypothetical protein
METPGCVRLRLHKRYSVLLNPRDLKRPCKSFTLNVLQQIDHSRRPSVTVAANCLTESNDFRVRTAVEGNLWLNHTSSS